jgi:hypothetical protein
VSVQVIRMEVNRNGFVPSEFTLRKGVPVKWVIRGEELGYCTHRITVPSLNLEFDVQPGENVIEFTPPQSGIVPWSCWMGMISGTFLVHEDPRPAAPPAMVGMHEHGHGHHHGGDSKPQAQWLKSLLAKSAAAVEALRKNLRP